jgi:hypothetical protein
MIQATARKIGPAGAYDANGHSRQFGYGCINAQAAAQAVFSNLGTTVHMTTRRRPVRRRRNTAAAQVAAD